METELRAWLADLLGREAPIAIPDGLDRSAEHVWTSSPAHREALPMTPASAGHPSDRYATIGMWGHGVESNALYWIEARGPHRCFFRLALGGVYGDRAADLAHAADYLEGYARWRDAHEGSLEASELVHDMGTSTATLVLPGGESRTLRDVGLVSESAPAESRAARWWTRVAEQSHR